jgi:hypothetical protein
MSGSSLQRFDGSVRRGNLFRATGTPFNLRLNRAHTVATNIGEATLTFTSFDCGRFACRIGATSITKRIKRFSSGARKADSPRDNAAIFYQPGFDGWGVLMIQNGDTEFKITDHYDEAGRQMFATASSIVGANDSATGTLFRTRSNGNSL